MWFYRDMLKLNELHLWHHPWLLSSVHYVTLPFVLVCDSFGNLACIFVFFCILAIWLVSSSHKKATLDLLSDGLNKAVAVVGEVLFFVKHETVTPL